MLLVLAFLTPEIIHLGIGGVSVVALTHLLIRAQKSNREQQKDNKELQSKMLDEINKRDERTITLQESTLTALIKSSEVIEDYNEKTKNSK